MTSRIDAWRSELTRGEVALVETKAGELMLRHGYEPTLPKPEVPADLLASFDKGAERRRREEVDTKRRIVEAQAEAAKSQES